MPRWSTYSVVREVGIRLRDTGAVGSCVELNALRCSQKAIPSSSCYAVPKVLTSVKLRSPCYN